MIGPVNPVIAALLGALGGLLLGGLLVAIVIRSRVPEKPQPSDLPPVELGSIVEALRCGAVVVGHNDELVATNEPAHALGLVRGTRLGIPAVHDLVRQVRADGETVAVNLDQVRGRGRPALQLAVRVVPLSGGRTLVVGDDRAPALRVQASSRDFMANATHELKTPIGAISLLAEAVEGAADDPAAVVRFAGKIHTEADRLALLVSQFITLSRLQGLDPMNGASAVDVDVVVQRALDRCRHLATGHEVVLTSGGTPDLWVRGDAEQLEAAVTNLVQNAINYSARKGRVVVTTRREVDADGELTAIAVSDNGIGIAPEEQQRVFERFYRVDYARSRETGGTGLGLSIVKEIAEGHGGEVTVWSKPGSGSTFTLRLPAAEAPDPEGEPWPSS